MARASKIMTPTSCFTGQVHYLPDAPEAYGAVITRAKAAPRKATPPTSQRKDLPRIHTSEIAEALQQGPEG
ncbi:hypothetical protein GCM10018780_92380 [Streptomyces lanatus]|nr:hypothetical protein GCM10018780_92380 [Streptomyces lanatus]